MFLLRQAEMIEAVKQSVPTTGALKLSCRETSIEEYFKSLRSCLWIKETFFS